MSALSSGSVGPMRATLVPGDILQRYLAAEEPNIPAPTTMISKSPVIMRLQSLVTSQFTLLRPELRAVRPPDINTGKTGISTLSGRFAWYNWLGYLLGLIVL